MDPTFSGTATRVAFLVTIGSWAVGERYLGCRDLWIGARRKGSQDRGTVWWTAGSILVAVAVAFALSTVDRLDLPGPDFWIVLGLTVAWLGIALRAWSVRTLGRHFTTIVIVREDYHLITSGPYRWLRHPSYTGLLLVLVGLGLALDNLGSVLAMLLIPIVGLRKRIAVEEAALQAQFGERYVEFAHDRARLVPFVW